MNSLISTEILIASRVLKASNIFASSKDAVSLPGELSVFIVSKGNHFDIYFTTLQLLLVPCGGGRTSPRTSLQCRLYFISFGIIGPIVVYLKMEFCSCIR